MLFRDYQRQVMRGMLVTPTTDRVAHAALGLTGEAGEVADIVKKSQYKDGSLDEAHLKEELGDVLWYLTYLAGHHGWTLEDLARDNNRKLCIRRPDQYTPIP